MSLPVRLRFVLLCMLSIAGSSIWAQTRPDFTQEWRFAQYLSDKDAFDEAAYVLGNIKPDGLTPAQLDSLLFFRGWIAYSTKSLDEASRQLLQVSPTSAFYLKSQYFGAYCLAFQGQRQQAADILQKAPATDSSLHELKALQLGGIALLQRQYEQYDRQRQAFSYGSYAMANEEKRMDDYRKQLQSARRRSPVVAGLYSALVPGLGKVYAGKTKQGIASFLPVLTLGLLTYEGLRKDGPLSARFIGFGSLFTVFYVGNIWGSVLSVNIKRSEFNRVYDNKILFDMHIPIRNLLN
ncbi:tetratricopeptide repeat protein [Arsenicibacter rosenii]|uniref:Tetratricopeptide repeat protein n=1 Tax=Arsenicibacter rosenii TaxID=1750698 RepID=A0A1S2VBT1_9BACT|nr:hypothetical protein [Arsenicibacter rosenii]OIN56163.1 hypothetical protein BLX24_26145 [Arsenicibacter rosenii]